MTDPGVIATALAGHKTDNRHGTAALPSPPPLVSVVIPTYNRLEMLAQAIDSVLTQTCRPLELIVVDDGSTDETPALLDAYGDRIQVLRQSRQGVSAARNTGIRHARGRWIAFLDSDDSWQPEKLAAQVDYCRSHPNVRICQTEEIWIRRGRRVNPGKRHKKPSGMIFEPSLELCLISPSAVMLQRSLLAEVGLFDESLPACEDYDLWLRITWKHQVHLIDRPLIIKRGGHDDQLSRLPELDKYRIRALVKILSQGCLPAAQHAAALAVLDRKCAIYAAGCDKRGRSAEAQDYRNLARQWSF